MISIIGRRLTGPAAIFSVELPTPTTKLSNGRRAKENSSSERHFHSQRTSLSTIKERPTTGLRPSSRSFERHADDDRNFVKKAVNWALRQIGKRSIDLNKKAIDTAERIKSRDTKSARWIASDALRELNSEKVLERLKTKKIRSS
jgi:3-methyladenine DNA glycosylase AlkC